MRVVCAPRPRTAARCHFVSTTMLCAPRPRTAARCHVGSTTMLPSVATRGLHTRPFSHPSSTRHDGVRVGALKQDAVGQHGAPHNGAFLAATALATLVNASAGPALAVSGGGGISSSLADMDFTGQNLQRRNFAKVVMRQTNFSNADMQGATLFGALATKARFTGANLTNADLESADFEKADFTNAILQGAYVSNAQFKGITIEGSDWSEVDLRKDVRKQLCSIASGVNPVTGVETRDSLQCP